jgi:hypothetical protein
VKRKKVLFICRYSLNEIDGTVNYSVNRKVSGILSLFQELGFSTWILKTSDFKSFFNTSKSIRRIENNLILNFNYKIKYLPRIVNYLFSIIYNAYLLKKIEHRFEKIIFWDYLPDTFLPVFLSQINKYKLIGDIEELISKDPEASVLFKKFELFFLNRFILNKNFVSNKLIQLNKKTNSFVINGFFAENINEEKICKLKLTEYNKSNKIRVFYSSRFDENRGIDVILKLIELDRINQFFHFVICGFGSKEYLKKLKKFETENVQIHYEVKRESFLSLLINSEVSINLLKNNEFALNSFPSKLIEYNCLGGIIISNVIYDEIKNNCIETNFSSNEIYSKLIELSKGDFLIRDLEKNYSEIEKYSIKNVAKKLNFFLNDQ